MANRISMLCSLILAALLLIGVSWLGSRAQTGLTTSGSTSELRADGRVAEDHEVVPTGWPGLRITAVTPPQGTRLLGAWVIPAEVADSVPLADLATDLLADGRGYELPAEVVAGRTYRVIRLVEIVDCASFTEPADPFGEHTAVGSDGAEAGPSDSVVHLRTAIGSTAAVAIPGPGWTRDDVEQYSACPPGT